MGANGSPKSIYVLKVSSSEVSDVSNGPLVDGVCCDDGWFDDDAVAVVNGS